MRRLLKYIRECPWWVIGSGGKEERCRQEVERRVVVVRDVQGKCRNNVNKNERKDIKNCIEGVLVPRGCGQALINVDRWMIQVAYEMKRVRSNDDPRGKNLRARYRGSNCRMPAGLPMPLTTAAE